MSVLVFGVSHRSAPVAVLEQLAADESEQGKLVERVLQSPLVTEAMLLSTCNRVEVYAVVDAFHGGLSVISQVLADHAGMSVGELTKHAYVRYSEAAVEHLFSVTSGLDSAVIGEQQVLGQVRRASAAAEAGRSVGRILHDLAQRALTAGKRVQAETGIAAAGASVVSVALHIAAERLYRPELGPSYTALTGRTVTVIGAGSMGSLAAALLVRLGVGHVNVVNRSLPRAQRLVEIIAEQGVGAQAMTLDELPAALAAADLAVSCTGAVRPVVTLADVHHALAGAQRDESAEPLVLCDLGMPRDIDAAVAGLPGVCVIDMERLQREPAARAAAAHPEAAREIVATEVAADRAGQRMAHEESDTFMGAVSTTSKSAAVSRPVRKRLSSRSASSNCTIFTAYSIGSPSPPMQGASTLPVIGTTAGAIPDTVPAAAGLLVEPGDVDALRDALHRIMVDHALRQRLSDGARQAAAVLPDWPAAVGRWAEAADRLAA